MDYKEQFETIIAQQLAFGEWYTNYKKKLDAIDYCWVSYHRIMKDFQNEDISLREAYTRPRQGLNRNNSEEQ